MRLCTVKSRLKSFAIESEYNYVLQSNRGKRSLVFSMDATKKPTTLSEMVTTVYNQEYKLPVYQQFQESIKKRIQGY